MTACPVTMLNAILTGKGHHNAHQKKHNLEEKLAIKCYYLTWKAVSRTLVGLLDNMDLYVMTFPRGFGY